MTVVPTLIFIMFNEELGILSSLLPNKFQQVNLAQETKKNLTSCASNPFCGWDL